MAMQFAEPVNDETIARIRELFGEPFASDRKTFLFDSLPPRINGNDMREIANRAKQPATLEILKDGDVRTVGDTRYLVTPQGWRRL